VTIPAQLHSGSERRFGPLDRRRGDEYETTTFRIIAKSDHEQEVQVECIGDFTEVDGLVIALLQHDVFTRMHVLHVNRLAAAWSQVLGFDSYTTRTFLQGALLHDAGKIVIRDDLLMAARSLRPEEYVEVKRHVEFGTRLLAPYARLRRVRTLVEQHHEWYDGSGYPNGLAGDEIDEAARALSVIDAYSAMTVDRPYHRGVTDSDALEELERFAGTQFDPVFVHSFLKFRRSAIGRGIA
jgi:HD-GYP domain-containing protein (c-di-GMP phosphodiesterase class II)